MKLLCAFLAFSVSLSLAAKMPSFHSEAIEPQLDPEEDDNMAQFDEDFSKPKITDPEEEAKHEKALTEDEAVVKKENEEFVEGKKTWEDEVNKFADMPADEFEKDEEGAEPGPEEDFQDTLMAADSYARGALAPTQEEVDRMENKFGSYFASVRASFDRSQYPAYFSSVDRGWVTPVKNQGRCASCVAFASMATIETCFKRLTGDDGDYSEQQMVDCAWGKNGANGCDPSRTDSYLKYAKQQANYGFAAEASYPYKDAVQRCSNKPAYKRGAKMTGYLATFSGTENVLMHEVANRGAAQVGIDSSGWSAYSGGVYAGGPSNTQSNHAVTVVGWGSDPREGDYWLIKNSWGDDWGEAGYIRLQRGTGMCGIGKSILVSTCEKVAGPISAPLAAPAQPCMDKEHGKRCVEYAAKGWCGVTNNQQIVNYMKMCSKSCGRCPGDTPAKAQQTASTCIDVYTNCNELAQTYCGAKGAKTVATMAKCPRSCGKCPGMTPSRSNYCWNEWSVQSCSKYTQWCSRNSQVANNCKMTCGHC